MKFGSVCSGIEAASVAWEPLGWEAQWFSEIEHFPSAVLNHRFPTVPNLGDMTLLHENQIFHDSTIDLLVGGTPCQSFSVAGLRKGLTDPRGNLMLTFLSLAQRKKPRWIVWENVPGVLSSNGGRDFATFLTALGQLGYGFAYRVLDAQYFGVAQRRRRVFVVGYLGDWRPAGAVLFECESLSGDFKKSREKRKATSADAQGGSGSGGFRMTAFGEYADDNTASTLKQRDYKDATDLVAHKPSWWNGEQTAATLTKQNANGAQRMPDKDNFGAVLEPTKWIPPNGEETIGTLRARDYKGIGNDDLEQGRGLAITQPVAHAFKVRGGSEDNTGEQGGTPGKKAGKGYLGQDEKVFTIGTTQDQQIMQPITFRKSRRAKSKDDHETWVQDNKANTINTFDVGDVRTTQSVVQPLAVDCYNQTVNEKTSQTIGSSASDVNHYGAVLQPVAGFLPTQGSKANGIGYMEEQAPTLRAGCDVYGVLQPNIAPTITQCKGSRGGSSMEALDEVRAIHAQQPTMAIRRLTPTECERLQGFPDDWTLIPYRNKSADQCPDGPRYKACGNSMAVPVMRWIGERIQMVEQLMKEINENK